MDSSPVSVEGLEVMPRITLKARVKQSSPAL
jgi:hypothetical protein